MSRSWCRPGDCPARWVSTRCWLPGAARRWRPWRSATSDLAFLQYTGGTTGVAKGAMLSHGNMVANVLQVATWMARDMKDGEETVVLPLPLYHVFALTGSLAFFSKGALAVLIANPRDLPAFIETLRQTGFTAIVGVNTLYRALLDAPGFAALDLKPAEARGGRRHGGPACGGPALEDRPPACRWSRATASPRPRRWRSPTRSTSRNGAARSACRCRAPRRRSSTMTAGRCRSARWARSACAARR